MNRSTHNWVRYWKNEKISGTTMPGEDIEIRSSFILKEMLREFFEAGFEIETILPKKIDADSYCDILLKRQINKIE
jgi:hypothetical protein